MADEQQQNQTETSNGVNPLAVLFTGLAFFPAAFVATGFYLLLRKVKLRFISIFQIFLIFQLAMFIAWKLIDPLQDFTNFFSHPGQWKALIPGVLVTYFIIGALAGLVLCWWEIREMKANPHRLELPGSWQYEFKFKRTLSQVRKRAKRILGLKSGDYADADMAPLGINEDEQDRIVNRYYDEANTHTLVLGAPGSGKSITLLSLILNDIIQGKSSIIIDFKRSPEFASKVAAWSAEYNRNFYHFVNGALSNYDIRHASGQRKYDPTAHATATAKADMILGMREYDTASAVYKTNMQQLLQVTFNALEVADRSKAPSIRWGEGGFYELASAISKDNFTELAIACEGTSKAAEVQEVAEALKVRGSSLRHAIEELQGQLRTIIASEYGPWLRVAKTDDAIDLLRLTSEPGNIILFSLNSDSEKEFASYMGAMILADITNLSAARRNAQLKNQVMVYVDEFQAVNPESIKSLLEKARESKLAVTLAQQSFDQIAAAAANNGESYLKSITDTCSNFILHNGMTEDSAERAAKLIGKEWKIKYTEARNNANFFLSLNWKNRRESKVQTREEEDWKFSPSQFMSLDSPVAANDFKSTAIIVNKGCLDPDYANIPGTLARKTWMIPNSKVLGTYYDPTYRLSEVQHEEAKREAAILEDEAPSPQDNDYLATRKLKRESAERNLYNDAITSLNPAQVDDDEDWTVEALTPEEQEIASYKRELGQALPPVKTTPRRVAKMDSTDSVLSQWDERPARPTLQRPLPSVAPPRRTLPHTTPTVAEEIEDAPLPPL